MIPLKLGANWPICNKDGSRSPLAFVISASSLFHTSRQLQMTQLITNHSYEQSALRVPSFSRKTDLINDAHSMEDAETNLEHRSEVEVLK
jgi:hypothetical protein